jgi:hypothetical protein
MAIHQSNCVFHCGYYIKIFSPPSLIGFIFLISQMTVVLAPDIYRAQWYIKDKHATFLLFRQIKFIYIVRFPATIRVPLAYFQNLHETLTTCACQMSFRCLQRRLLRLYSLKFHR